MSKNLVRLIEYHNITATTLRADIMEGNEGYKKAMVSKDLAGIVGWMVLYDKAAQYHERRYGELLAELPGGQNTYLSLVTEEDTDYAFNHTCLGGEPTEGNK